MKTLPLILTLVVLSLTGCVTLAKLDSQAKVCVAALEEPTQKERNVCWQEANALADEIQNIKLKRATRKISCPGDLVAWCKIYGRNYPRPEDCQCINRGAMMRALGTW